MQAQSGGSARAISKPKRALARGELIVHIIPPPLAMRNRTADRGQSSDGRDHSVAAAVLSRRDS